MIKLLILTRSCYQPVNTIHKLHKKIITIHNVFIFLLHKGPVLCDNPPVPIIKPISQPEPYNKYRHYSSLPLHCIVLYIPVLTFQLNQTQLMLVLFC